MFSNISLSANTVAEQISKLSFDSYDQLRNKARVSTAYCVTFGENTDITNNTQLAIFISGINDQFKVTEELLSL